LDKTENSIKIAEYGPLKNKILSFADWIFIMRPTMLFTYWTMVMCGLGMHGKMESISLITVASISFGMGAANLLNLVNDIEADLQNNKLPWLSHGLIRPKQVVIYLGALYLLGLIGLVFQAGMDLVVTSILVFGGLGLLYNIGPSPLKRRPLLSLLMSAVIGAGLWIVGVAALSELYNINWIALIGYVSAWTSVCLISMIPDIKGDRNTGKITFAVKYGSELTARLSTLVLLIALVYSIVYRDIILLVPAVISFPFFIAAALESKKKWISMASKSSVLSLSMMVAFNYFPKYIILIVVYYFFSRWYYKERFNINYPTVN